MLGIGLVSRNTKTLEINVVNMKMKKKMTAPLHRALSLSLPMLVQSS
jgi:hypothetical protein